MNDKKKKRKQIIDPNSDNLWKPTADELEVANYLYHKLPVLEARASRMIVRVFSATDAVDLLMESPWAYTNLNEIQKNKNSKPRLFANQASAIAFLTGLFQKQLFYRAIRVKKKTPISKKTLKAKSKKSSDVKDLSPQESPLENDRADLTDLTATDKASPLDQDAGAENSTKSSSSSSSSSKRMRVEAAAADQQVFVLDDPESVYVWVYEPPPGLFNWLAGTALLLGIVLCCLFPIWPAQLRVGAYYLTTLAAGMFGLLLLVALLRLVCYMGVWLVTAGNYGFWLFPNYFKDCGFFESFRPVYSVSVLGKKTGKKTKSSGRKDKSQPKSTTSDSVSNSDGLVLTEMTVKSEKQD